MKWVPRQLWLWKRLHYGVESCKQCSTIENYSIQHGKGLLYGLETRKQCTTTENYSIQHGKGLLYGLETRKQCTTIENYSIQHGKGLLYGLETRKQCTTTENYSIQHGKGLLYGLETRKQCTTTENSAAFRVGRVYSMGSRLVNNALPLKTVQHSKWEAERTLLRSIKYIFLSLSLEWINFLLLL